MTFLEQQQEVSRRLAEVGGRVYWTSDDIKEALNLGYAEISDATEWNETWSEIALLADRPYYDLRRVLGESFLAIRPAFDRQTNRWVIPTALRQLDAHDRRWERVTGEPQRVLLRGLWWLGFYPRIQADRGTVKQYWVALPDPMVNADDEPGFPDIFHYGLVDFALADLWAQDAETAFALQAWQAYLATEAGLGQWVEARMANPLMQGFVGSDQPGAR